MRILLGVTGSVAAVLTKKIVKSLQAAGHEVRVVVTESARFFFQEKEVEALILKDEDEWPAGGYTKDMPVLHVRLRDWADVLLIAPLTANTLAKLANGLCDNLLTCVFRAWDPQKPIILAPAMNTKMWEHPHTSLNLQSLEYLRQAGYSIEVISPISKTLACGDTGIGAMAEIDTIVQAVNIKP